MAGRKHAAVNLRAEFASRLVAWQKRHGRHDLPWQNQRDAYRVWVSEIMLQQTQVAAVIPFYRRFLERFPDLDALAAASADDVLGAWSGLGYYTRARNLHRAAQVIMERHHGAFPRRAEEIAQLPGIGRSTAAAMAVFAFDARAAILDGNVKRVLCRAFAVEGFPGAPAVQRRLWDLAEALLPRREVRAYTQGLMDLGATLCTRARPRCDACPLAVGCAALATGRTGELPQPRAPRRLAERRVQWVIALDADAVLLLRRPPSGVWGGMWCLPELDADADLSAWCEARFGVSGLQPEPLPEVSHGFTHFTLRARPSRVRVRGELRRAGEPGDIWLSLSHLDGAALPAPVKRLLRAQAAAGRPVDVHQDRDAAPR